jgi:pimeloyl-ACP methyl ester carboxylesterase
VKTIYGISGLGADERAFSKLNLLPGVRLQVLPWLQPHPGEPIGDYALRMSKGITEPDPILMGLSFGGIMCTEIARQVPVKKIIIISSIKTSAALPGWMRTVSFLRLYKIVPLKSSRFTASIQNRFLGVTGGEDRQVAEHYRKHADIRYVNWAVDKIMNWKNNWVHPRIFHIHGDNDKMFPIRKVRPDFCIKRGGHFMIMNRAPEVSDCINAVLQKPD